MGILGYFSVVGALVGGFFLVRKVLSEFTGPSREDQYQELDEQFKKADRKITGPNTPRCPHCGGDTERYEYPHLRVWRCINFPECRGFVKATRGGAGFARKWHGR
ncbi:MAG: hypothetical protein KAH54_00935 [Candidatus Sabulitectum sp.]|nr:hypothetical protein [Candidatus Sabulitectum sp.]